MNDDAIYLNYELMTPDPGAIVNVINGQVAELLYRSRVLA